MTDEPLMFLHLSDIHFRKWSGEPFDNNEDLRNELLIDVASFAKALGQPHGIFISGDIAFSGSEDEYLIAKSWLRQVCDKVGRSFADVWCVPGNHDVDRGYAEQNALPGMMHKNLQEIEPTDLNSEVGKYLGDSGARELIFKSIIEYNRFASSFQCQLSHTEPFWSKDFKLNDGSPLRIIGLTSTLFSGKLDDKYKKVVLGQFQLPLREEGVTLLTICHHPPVWWRDADMIESKMDSRVRIQLFAHKHLQRVVQIDNTLRLNAGAVHPDPQKDKGEPCFNWLRISVSGQDTDRKLRVEVYPRIWDDEAGKFIPDTNSCGGNDHKQVSLDLDPWESPIAVVQTQPSEGESIGPESDANAESETRNMGMDAGRVLTYRFFDHPHIVRIDIARKLDLYRDEDEGLQDFELFELIFRRAVDENRLAELWNEVEKRHGDNKYPSNPFEPHDET